MKPFLKLLLIFCYLIFVPASVNAQALENIDSRYPERKYRRFLLPNKMKVMLISDITLQRGAASMTVAVGSMSDPENRYGMAHFLEHMPVSYTHLTLPTKRIV